MELNTVKQIVSIVAVVLTFVAYVPYYRDIIKGKTHPHVYSWTLWGLLGALVVALQIKGGAGAAAYVSIAACMLCVGVVVLGLKHGKKDITTSDTIVAILGLAAIGFWLIVDQPVVSVLLVIAADILAFIPTVRKSWIKPYSETLSLYVTNTIRFSMALFAVEVYTILSSLWIVVWVVANGLFALMLVYRRKRISA